MCRVVLFTAAFLIVTVGTGLSEDAAAVRPTILQPSSSKLLSVPAFGFFDAARLDAQGNIYIHPDPFDEPSVLKISPSSNTVVYQLSSSQTDKLMFYDYAVTPSGTVWMLANPPGSPELRAFEFDSNGQVRSSMELQNPPDTFAREFLAFENGTLFVAGYYTDKAQESLRGHSFVALFDSSGRMVRNLRDTLSSVDLRVVQKAPFEGGSTVGEDGNAYMVDARKILVLSPGGEVTRRIPFEKPSADLVVGGIYVSGNQAAIRVAKWTEKSVENSFLLLDLSSGKLVAWYVPGKEMGYAAAGFSRNEGFTFLANEQGKMKLVRSEVK